MDRILKIYLTKPSPDLVHQWRNFGEDVYRALRDECDVSIEEIDALRPASFIYAGFTNGKSFVPRRQKCERLQRRT